MWRALVTFILCFPLYCAPTSTVGLQGLSASIYGDIFTTYLNQQTGIDISQIIYQNDSALTQDVLAGKLNFTFTGPPLFACLQYTGVGLNAIAEVIQRSYLNQSQPVENLAGAVVVPAASNISDLHGLVGKQILGGQLEQTSTFLSQWAALNATGINLFKDALAYFITTNATQIPFDILAGAADAGFMTAGTLENLTQSGYIPYGALRVLSPQVHPGYPYQHSTHLFPNSVFAAVDPVTFDTRREVAEAFFSLEPTSPQTTGKFWGFAPNRDLTTVRGLLRATGQVDVLTGRCVDASKLSSVITCPPGFNRIANLSNACLSKGIKCAPAYTCICAPCVPAVQTLRVLGLTEAVFITLVILVAAALVMVAYVTTRLLLLKRVTIASRSLVLHTNVPPLGQGSNGLVLSGTLEGRQVAVKRVCRGNRSSLSPFNPKHSQKLSCRPGLDLSFLGELAECFGYHTNARRSLKLALKRMDVHHSNIIACLGVAKSRYAEVLVVTPLMETGSVANLIYNKQYRLDSEAVNPVAMDVANAMAFFHGLKPPKVGVNLKPHHLLLDTSWRTLLGLSFRTPNTQSVWAPPECLRGCPWTKAGDVYSFGMLLYTLMHQHLPFEGHGNTELLEMIKDATEDTAVDARPPMTGDGSLHALVRRCWAENPADRPDFEQVKEQLTASDHPASFRPSITLQRRHTLLEGMFPDRVRDLLEAGLPVPPCNHPQVTVFFSDIKDFTDISRMLLPELVQSMLNRLYLFMDKCANEHQVHKMETIGDCWFGVTNLMQDQCDHAVRMARFAIDVARGCCLIPIDITKPSGPFLSLRIGMHSGPVTSGVVGSLNVRFCLFGNTVNVGSRMESTGKAGRVQITQETAELLKADPVLACRIRRRPGMVDVKGQGAMKTFWLLTEVHMERRSSLESKNSD